MQLKEALEPRAASGLRRGNLPLGGAKDPCRADAETVKPWVHGRGHALVGPPPSLKIMGGLTGTYAGWTQRERGRVPTEVCSHVGT